ncbi:MAG: ABC transporter permease [Rhodospirillaceae bacterium]|nr:ABC transporter permease [Rhodospirillaceae bacterium]
MRGPEGQTYSLLSADNPVFTLANYARAIEWIHLGIIWKSVWLAAVTTVACLVMGFPLALGVAFAAPRWKNLLLLLVILPFWTNLLVRTYAWIAVLRTRGFLNMGLEWLHDRAADLLGLFGAGDLLGPFQPLELLYNQTAVIVGLVYVNLPFMVLPLYATLEKLDRSYLEASLDLGAGQVRTFLSVLVPLSLPGIASGTLLVFILSVGAYLTPDLLGGTDSEMIGTLIGRQFGASRDWPFGSALSFLLLYATFVFLWLRAMLAGRSGQARL